MNKIRKYSKAIAGLVSAAVAFVAIQFIPDLDTESVQAIVLSLLTAIGVYAAPANTE